MNRIGVITAGILVAVLATGVVSAQGPRAGGPGGPGGGPGGRGARGGGGLALQALDLTEAQQERIRNIRQQERETLSQFNERMQAATKAQRAAVETVPVNEGLIRQTTEARAAVQAEAAVQRSYVHSQIWAVLTPAQQAQATKLRAEREARSQERRQGLKERRQNRQ